jgi:hypothetical protein
MRARARDIIERAERVGLRVQVARPGDGAVRYTFFETHPAEDGQGGMALWPIGTATGRAAALAFVQGYEQGAASAEERRGGA